MINIQFITCLSFRYFFGKFFGFLSSFGFLCGGLLYDKMKVSTLHPRSLTASGLPHCQTNMACWKITRMSLVQWIFKICVIIGFTFLEGELPIAILRFVEGFHTPSHVQVTCTYMHTMYWDSVRLRRVCMEGCAFASNIPKFVGPAVQRVASTSNDYGT